MIARCGSLTAFVNKSVHTEHSPTPKQFGTLYNLRAGLRHCKPA
jgi:hypothetical protein